MARNETAITNYYYQTPGTEWVILYENDVPDFLARGLAVKRVTITRLIEEELLS